MSAVCTVMYRYVIEDQVDQMGVLPNECGLHCYVSICYRISGGSMGNTVISGVDNSHHATQPKIAQNPHFLPSMVLFPLLTLMIACHHNLFHILF